MNRLLYKVPEHLLHRLKSGEAELFGFVSHVARGIDSSVTGAFNPLGIVSTIQNEQIKSQLIEMRSVLGFMQNLQWANLAISGLGLGITIAGFRV